MHNASYTDINFKHFKCDLDIIENELTGFFDGLKLSFKPLNSEEIYQKSNGEVVRDFNGSFDVKLNNRDIVKFNSLLIENISTYLYNIRKEILVDKEIRHTFSSDFDENKKMEIIVDRNFTKLKEVGKYKIHIKIFDKATNIELVELHLTKKDLLLFVSLLNELMVKFQKISVVSPISNIIDYNTNELSLRKKVIIGKIENAIVINDVWLHGQEILNLMYVVEKLIYGYKIEESLPVLRSSFRQLEFIVENEDSLEVKIRLSKMSKDGEVFAYSEEEKTEISLNSLTLSAFMLFLNPEMLRINKGHADFSETTRPELGKNIKYHISMKEASLGIGIQTKPLVNRKGKERIEDKETVLVLAGKSKHIDIDKKTGKDLSMEKIYEKGSSDYNMVHKLDDFYIPLGKHWKTFVGELIKAYNSEYTYNDKLNNRFAQILVQEKEGNVVYKLKFLSDKGNKAKFVLIVDKFKFENKEMVLVGRFRQPLFEKYVYELIQLIMANAYELNYFETVQEIPYKELYPFEFKNKKDIVISDKDKLSQFGFKRERNKITFGDFKYKNKSYELSEQDSTLIYLSAKFRILQGRWLPVIGHKICIAQDGYITGLFSEFKIEKMKDEFEMISTEDKEKSEDTVNDENISKLVDNEEINSQEEITETKVFRNRGSEYAIEYLFATSK